MKRWNFVCRIKDNYGLKVEPLTQKKNITSEKSCTSSWPDCGKRTITLSSILEIGIKTAGDARRFTCIADNYARCGFRFVPLIGDRFGSLGCALDILFLRRDQPGDIVKSGGDIDNRIKVLFDALKIPQECNELPRGVKPDADEDPFFCLLQDDKLIVEVKITTDRLLMPLAADEHIHDVHLIIHVRTVRLMDQAFSRRLDD